VNIWRSIQGGEDWVACVHPEGALYFHNTVRGIYTDSDLQKQERRCKMDSCVSELLDLAATKHQLNLTGGVDIELVVQSFRKRSGEYILGYYFVDHPNRLLFWVHEQPTEKLFDGVLGVEKKSHIRYALEHQYWQVCHCIMRYFVI